MKSFLNINLFAGPGTGKSTVSAGLFYQMKVNGKSVELVQEYAKDLVYDENYNKLGNQLHVLAEQSDRLKRLIGKVNYVVHDSPFIMGLAYLDTDKHTPKPELKKLALEMFNSYSNLNIFLIRDEGIGYQTEGRNQTFKEAKLKDKEIMSLLDELGISYHKILVTEANELVIDMIELTESKGDIDD